MPGKFPTINRDISKIHFGYNEIKLVSFTTRKAIALTFHLAFPSNRIEVSDNIPHSNGHSPPKV